MSETEKTQTYFNSHIFCRATIRKQSIPSNGGINAKNNETCSEDIHSQQDQEAANTPSSFVVRSSTDGGGGGGGGGILKKCKNQTYNIVLRRTNLVRKSCLLP